MKPTLKISISLFFIIGVAIYTKITFGDMPYSNFLILATIFGAYMAMNIGANDVANNVGPVVGSGSLTIIWAIVIATIFEVLGALIAGGDVIKTIKKGIIDPSIFNNDPIIFIYAMSAALLSAAIWLNVATWLKAPVSTTHSIVGGVMGGGIAAGGFIAVSWIVMGKIILSWLISPLLGGLISASFLYLIKQSIMKKEDMLKSAKLVVPILISIMTAVFILYLTIKGLKKIWVDITEVLTFLPDTKEPSIFIALAFGLISGLIIYFPIKIRIEKRIDTLENNRESLNQLFIIPLIFSAAMLSFAHGANDVANAVGPLAAIYDSISNLQVSSKASIPLWIMIIGGVGIALGLILFGARLIKTVGSEITELDQIRAFSIMMAAAIAVIIASQLGLPVSSTHIAIGAIFGVGFLREWLDNKDPSHKREKIEKIKRSLNDYKSEFKNSTDNPERKLELYDLIKANKKRLKKVKKVLRKNYIKQGMIKKIITAWVVTVPAVALLSAIIFFIIKGVLN